MDLTVYHDGQFFVGIITHKEKENCMEQGIFLEWNLQMKKYLYL